MSQKWFYSLDGKKKFGPLSFADLKAVAMSGQIKPTDMILMDGSPKWIAASTVKGLLIGPQVPGKSTEQPPLSGEKLREPVPWRQGVSESKPFIAPEPSGPRNPVRQCIVAKKPTRKSHTLFVILLGLAGIVSCILVSGFVWWNWPRPESVNSGQKSTHKANAELLGEQEKIEVAQKPKEEPAKTEAKREKPHFIPLNIKEVATVSSSHIFSGESLLFPTWGNNTYHDVPFMVIDPEGGKTKNTICLYSRLGAISAKMPRTVHLDCNSPAKEIHFLGAAGWGFPWNREQTMSMLLKLEYADGEKEDHPLINGIHLTDWSIGPDVPESNKIGVLRVRYFSIMPKRQQKSIRAIEFQKGTDQTSPFVIAVTIETPVTQVARSPKEEPGNSARTEDDRLLATKVVGRFIFSVSGIHLDFTKEGRAIDNGEDIGAWRVVGGKVIITYSDERWGLAVLSFKDDHTLVGKNEHKNGDVFNWELKKEKTEVAQKPKEEPAKKEEKKADPTKAPKEITADYLPHRPGTVYLYDTDFLPFKGAPPSYQPMRVRTRCTFKEDGRVEAINIKEGPLTDGEFHWTNKLNKQSTIFNSLYRRRAGYIETGVTWDEARNEILWFPTIKCGAKEGDSWHWVHPFSKELNSKEERKYVVKGFGIYKGRPSVEIAIESTQQLILRGLVVNYIHRKTYSEGVGLVKSTTEWTFPDEVRDGKPKWELTVVTRIVENEKDEVKEEAVDKSEKDRREALAKAQKEREEAAKRFTADDLGKMSFAEIKERIGEPTEVARSTKKPNIGLAIWKTGDHSFTVVSFIESIDGSNITFPLTTHDNRTNADVQRMKTVLDK